MDVLTNGGNYGWPFREGTRDNSGDTGRTTPAGFTSLAPIADYTHGDGIAVIGGVAYRGASIPSLAGKYVLADLGGTSGSTARLFYVDAANGGVISEFNYDPTGLTPSANVYGFGTDANNEVYAFFSNGDILRLSAVPEPAAAGLLGVAALGLLPRHRRRR